MKRHVVTYTSTKHWRIAEDIEYDLERHTDWEIQHLPLTYDLDRKSFVALVVYLIP